MSQRIVYFNGVFGPESQARVSIYDSALAMGDMAFEVTRTIHGRPFRLDDHLARLFHTLDVLRIDPACPSPSCARSPRKRCAATCPASRPKSIGTSFTTCRVDQSQRTMLPSRLTNCDRP